MGSARGEVDMVYVLKRDEYIDTHVERDIESREREWVILG